MKDYSLNLNELCFDATKTFDLIVGGSQINFLFLTYFGNTDFGGFNITSENLEPERKRWKYVSLKTEKWKTLYKLIEAAKLEELPAMIHETYSYIKDNQSYDILYDGPTYTLKITSENKTLKLHREITKENQFIQVVNAMLESCPLIDQNMRQQYSCRKDLF